MKKGAIWVSTVLYILISLAIIGLVIAAVTPRINSARDRATIEQSILMMDNLDSTIQQVSQIQGTKLSSEFKMSKGTLTIDPAGEKITWRFENSAYKYSEEGAPINISNVQVLTTKSPGGWTVELALNYKNSLNITSAISAPLQPAEVPYKLWVENKGTQQGLIQVDISKS